MVISARYEKQNKNRENKRKKENRGEERFCFFSPKSAGKPLHYLGFGAIVIKEHGE